MKTLSSPVLAQSVANQNGWAEIYDIYLNTAITTPYGATSIIRITQCPGGLSFFTPTFSPEPVGTQGNAASYLEWPVKRQIIKGATRFTNDKLSIVVSNVTGEWAAMLNAVKWRNRPVVIRGVPLTLAGPTSADCNVLFSGTIDSAKVTDTQIQFVVSNNLAGFNVQIPRENMHTNCRAQFGDDLCGLLAFKQENYRTARAVGTGSTTKSIIGSASTEDAAWPPYLNQAVSINTGTSVVSLSGGATNKLNNGELVFLGGTALPTLNAQALTTLGLYAINCNAAGFQCSLTPGGSALAFASTGSGVTIAQADIASNHPVALYTAQAVTVSTSTGIVSVTGGGSTVQNNDVIFFGGTTLPTVTIPLTSTLPLYTSGCGSGGGTSFQLNLSTGGGKLSFATAGTAVTITTGGLYGPDLINNLSTGAITTSTQQTGFEGYQVQQSTYPTNHWRFSTTPGNPSTSVNTTAPFLVFDFGIVWTTPLKYWTITNGPADDVDYYGPRQFDWYVSSDNASWQPLYHDQNVQTDRFGSQNGAKTSYIIPTAQVWRYWKLVVRKISGDPFYGSPMGKVTAAATSGGTDQVDALANGSITSSDEVGGSEGYRVKTGQSGQWLTGAPAQSAYGILDWGVNYQGYWQIPDAQAGLANPALTPYIQFDFGSAVTPCVWRFQSLPNVPPQDIPRVISIFSSSSPSSGYVFEQYFELPSNPGQIYDCLIPKASNARYWRICVRSTWSEMVDYIMFAQIRAHVAARNWWAAGRITFDGNTTAALKGVSRQVTESYAGQLICVPLPVAPANGDTYTIERRCPRTFNACGERRNQPNFAGFTTMPDQTVIQ